MIRVLLILLGLSLGVNANAQKRIFLELDNSVEAISGTYRILAVPKIGLTTDDKNYFSIGPAVLAGTYIAASDKRFPKLCGAQLTYKNYPSLSEKRLNFFLYTNLNLLRIHDKYEASVWDEQLEEYSSYEYSGTEVLGFGHVGYGVELRLAKRFTINQSVGAGCYYSSYNGNEQPQEATTLGTHNINGYRPFGFSYQLKVGMRYLF